MEDKTTTQMEIQYKKFEIEFLKMTITMFQMKSNLGQESMADQIMQKKKVVDLNTY